MLLSRFLFIIPVALALCCTVSKEQVATFAPPEQISFKVLDKIDHSFEGSDNITILSTGANIESATLYVRTAPYILNYVSYPLTAMGNGRFETSLNFSPDQVRWYIGASSGLGSSTSYGTFNIPEVSEKYMKKTSADVLIKDILNSGLSSANVYQTYAPNSAGNTYKYIFTADAGPSLNVDLDHYTTLFQISGLHLAYGIEYSPMVTYTGNNQIPVIGANLVTDRLSTLQQSLKQNFGYVIIGTTDRGNMERILGNTKFFPQIPPEEAHLLNRLEVIRY